MRDGAGRVARVGPFLLLVVAVVPACDDSPTEPRVAVLELDAPAEVTLDLGFTLEVGVVLRDAAGGVLPGGSVPISWTSSDSAVARVDSVGAVRAAGPGEATIRAERDGMSASLAVLVPALVFRSVSAGRGMSCGVTEADVAYCWGENEDGALGNGTTEWDSVPAPVAGGQRFRSVSAHSRHACGLTPAGKAYCWGLNAAGRLGNGSLTQELHMTPQEVVGGLSFAAVDAGGLSTCGLTPEGWAYCWGDNDWGQLGFGSTADRAAPTPVAGGLTFTQIATGSGHACGLTHEGDAYCWGANTQGQLGDGSTTDRSVPTHVVGGLIFRSISAGTGKTCGVTIAGVGLCWGGNSHGPLGDGTETQRWTPTPVVGGHSFDNIHTGLFNTCGLRTDGSAYCWGYNLTGALGQPPAELPKSSVPVPVSGGLSFVELTSKDTHTCGRAPDGVWYCWGTNVFAQLGIGTFTVGSHEPVPIFGQR